MQHMLQTRISIERVVEAPADVVYHCIANYREHHRPEGFLPPVFSDFRVQHGGVDDGTVISFNMKLGGRTTAVTQRISEPQPGRVLVESGGGGQTTFTVEPEGQRCHVRFDTVLETNGLQGLMTRLLAPRLLKRAYAEELERLERHAQSHGEHAQSLGIHTPTAG